MDPFKMRLQGRADVRTGRSSLLWGVCVCACACVRARARAHSRARSSLSAEMRCVSRASSLFGETVGVCLDVAGCCWFVKASRRRKLGK